MWQLVFVCNDVTIKLAAKCVSVCDHDSRMVIRWDFIKAVRAIPLLNIFFSRSSVSTNQVRSGKRFGSPLTIYTRRS